MNSPTRYTGLSIVLTRFQEVHQDMLSWRIRIVNFILPSFVVLVESIFTDVTDARTIVASDY